MTFADSALLGLLKMKLRHVTCTAVLAILGAAAAYAGNPFVTDQFVADPSAKLFGKRVYVYFTNDSGNDGKYWNGRDWRLFSSADLMKWRDHGQIFSIDGFKWAKELAWAPEATYRDGTYYLYLPVDRTKIGVARAKSPTGPFTDAIGAPLVDKSRDQNVGDEPIDPAVFIDKDGQAYMYFGTRKPKVVKLGPDMVSLAGPIEDVTITNARVPYGEAPWLHQRNGIYYFSYSTGWPGQIAYATGKSPLGPFTHRGIILDRVNTTTNHQAIVERAGKWYLFYHNNSLPGGGEQRRSPNIDRLYYNADGTIRRVIPTKAGVGVAQKR
jgi:beta-xylosidase